jgi:radical SAM protein with 4Fe4S-binding SPASM domain
MLSYDNAKKLIDFCNEAKVQYVVLTGGEPAMYPNILELVQYIKSRPHTMKAALATNGILLANFDFCKQMTDSGLNYVDLSLKGNDEWECVEITGQNCFSQQLKAIHNLSLLPVDFTCSMVLTHENIHTFCEGIQSAYHNGARQFSFTFALDNEKSAVKDVEYLKGHNPYTLIDVFVAQIDRLNAVTKGEWWVEYTFPLCIYMEKQLAALKGKLAAPCQIHKGNSITFDTQMNLLPCNMYFENKLGQFGTDFSSYAEFKQSAERDLYRNTIDFLRQLPSDKCHDCSCFESCYGGCPVFWKNCSFEALEAFKELYCIP